MASPAIIILSDGTGNAASYVNDSVVALPWLYDWFYRGERHRGKANVTIRLL
jgi:hypothetical protein